MVVPLGFPVEELSGMSLMPTQGVAVRSAKKFRTEAKLEGLPVQNDPAERYQSEPEINKWLWFLDISKYAKE